MSKEKRSNAEIKYLYNLKLLFKERYTERIKSLDINNNQVSDRMLELYRSEIDSTCNKKFINHINKWCSVSEDNLSLPDFTNLLILSKVLDCDCGYLMGTQEKPQKEMEEYARYCGLQYESAIAFANYFKTQVDSRSLDLLNYILIKKPSALLDLAERLFTSLSQTDVYNHLTTNNGYDEDWIHNRHNYVYNTLDFSSEEYHFKMSLLEDWLRTHGAFSTLAELALSYAIYRHHYPYSYDDSLKNSISIQSITELESKHFTKI